MVSTDAAGAQPVWHILGAGAMGCLWASSLAAHRQRPRLLLRNRDRLRAYHGLTLEHGYATEAGQAAKSFDCEVTAVSDCATPVERLLVTTKAYAVLDALQSVASCLHAGSRVVLIQNGLGFQQDVVNRFPQLSLFCAVTTEGAWLREPYHVVHAGRGVTRLGAWSEEHQDQAPELCAELCNSGFEVTHEQDVQGALWRKWAINCVINPMSAAHNCRNGELFINAELRRATSALLDEISRVLERLGHADISATLASDVHDVAAATADNRSSMHQDLAHGRRTEIDYLNGYLCSVAERDGVDCPLNRALVQLIRDKQQSGN